MAKFCEFRDLFKWNKQLMEDDYNDGQAYFLKTVHKGGEAVSFSKVIFIDWWKIDNVGIHAHGQSCGAKEWSSQGIARAQDQVGHQGNGWNGYRIQT